MACTNMFFEGRSEQDAAGVSVLVDVAMYSYIPIYLLTLEPG